LSETANPPRKPLWPRVLVALLAIVVVAIASLYAFLRSQAALDYVVRRAVAAADGHLVIEGAEGSLLSTVRVARIKWTGDELDVEARDAALAWSPFDLISRKVHVSGLGAKRLSIDFKKAETKGGMPATLALPLEVEVRNIGVERLEWKTVAGGGSVTGIVFDYAGGEVRHEIRNLRLVTEQGTLAGTARVGANPPYEIAADFAFEGDGAWKTANAKLAVAGAAERMNVDASGAYRDADIAIKAAIAPFESVLLTSADIDARNVDLAKLADWLPTTDVALTLAARPQGAGFRGTLRATNGTPGPIDRSRVPVTAIASDFAWDGTTLALTAIDAQLAGSARARGSVSLAPSGGPVEIDLHLADVDLSQLQTSLIATRLSGTLAGEVEKDRQVLRGDVRQADLALAFDAAIQGRRVDLRSVNAKAGKGTLAGSGTIDLDAPRAFAIKARASRFDPSRFVASPEAELDGTVDARGTLAPLAVSGSVTVDKGSRLAGLDVAGTARGAVGAQSAKDLAVDAHLGASTIRLAGGYGTAADTLAYDVDVPRLAQLRPLAVRYAKLALPDPLEGSLRARGSVSGDPASPAVTLVAHGRALRWGRTVQAATLDVDASIGAGRIGGRAIPLEARPIKASVAATGLAVPQATLARATIDASGTLADHRATLAAAGDGFDATASVQGGVTDARRPDGSVDTAWNGTVQTLENRGLYPFALRSPARVGVARDRYSASDVHVTVADGHVDVADFLLEEGRITTHGSFTGVPAGSVAKLAGSPLPFASSLTIGGEWSIAATPRLSGTFSVRRERGDWYGTDSSRLDPSELALGITELAVSGRFADDALTASGRFRSARAGTLDAQFSLAAGREAGHVDTTAPFTASVNAQLPSLRPLQPWVGTLAVMDGRAQLALTARGSLADPIVEGTMRGDGLRFDLPQYGVHLKDGVLRARLAERTITLEELSLAGGAGRFTAKGTIAQAASQRALATAKVEWQASDFTIVNRPDLRLVADGKGVLALEDRKIALSGNIEVDEGRVRFEPSRVGTLSDDVVIVGQPRKTEEGMLRDLPLRLDVVVALGRDFRFEGEGLDTRLAGRVHVTTTPAGTLAGEGTIRAVAGTFTVFGQRLDIDRGRLIFGGPVDNPALDVVALRKNLAVEAGVELTGTVKVPRVRLVSNPPVPDNEKLSWLLTGHGTEGASRNDLAMLGAASASLLAKGDKPITQRIANSIGLDDISVRDSGSTITGQTSTQVVAFGKRISDRLNLVYEQGLTAATNALRIEYSLTRTLTLRAEAGVVSSLGLYFRRTFD
jgi:translocation and assembly module TamB